MWHISILEIKKTQPYAEYKKPTSPGRPRRVKVKERKKIFCKTGNPQRAGAATLIAEKVNFKLSPKRRQRKSSPKDKGVSAATEYNSKYICSQQ